MLRPLWSTRPKRSLVLLNQILAWCSSQVPHNILGMFIWAVVEGTSLSAFTTRVCTASLRERVHFRSIPESSI